MFGSEAPKENQDVARPLGMTLTHVSNASLLARASPDRRTSSFRLENAKHKLAILPQVDLGKRFTGSARVTGVSEATEPHRQGPEGADFGALAGVATL